MLWDYNYLRQIALNFLNWRIKKKSNRLLEEIVTLTNTLSFQLQQISTERRKEPLPDPLSLESAHGVIYRLDLSLEMWYVKKRCNLFPPICSRTDRCQEKQKLYTFLDQQPRRDSKGVKRQQGIFFHTLSWKD